MSFPGRTWNEDFSTPWLLGKVDFVSPSVTLQRAQNAQVKVPVQGSFLLPILLLSLGFRSRSCC